MAYGTVKVDNITFDQGGADQNVTASGIYRAITSGVTVSGTIAGAVLIGTTTVSGTTVTGTTANFASGVFTTQVSGATVTGTQSSFTSGNFVTLSGATATFTSGVIASGTAAAPSLSILGDANTGIYSPGADTLAFVEGGVEAMRIDSSGRLLVGTSTNVTSFQVQVEGTTEPNSALSLRRNNAGAFGPGFGFYKSRGTATGSFTAVSSGDSLGQLYFFGADGTQDVAAATITAGVDGTPGAGDMPGRLVFSTTADGASSPTERLRIDSSGRVGIGTSSPSAKFQIGSYSATVPSLTSNSGAVISTTDTANTQLNLGTDPSSPYGGWIQMRDTIANVARPILLNPLGGNVGIGTSSPSTLLDLSSSTNTYQTIQSTTSNANALTYYKNSAAVSSGFYVGFNADEEAMIWQTENNTIRFGTNNTERARIDSSGRVGIGTSSPGNLLHVSGTGTVCQLASSNNNNLINLKGNGATNGVWLGTTSSDDFLISSGASISERARIDSSGRLLVGTSTAQSGTRSQYSKFTVQGNNQSTGDGAQINLANNTNAPSLNTGDTLGQIIFTDNGPGEYGKIICQMDGAGAGTNDYPGRLVFSTTADGAASPTERMRINNAGNMLVGRTGTDGAALIQAPASSTVPSYGSATGDATAITHFEFRNSNGLVGTISTNASATAYNTSSDYRLKENVIAVTDGITRLQQLKPSRFNFIVDPDQTIDGFIAHEAQAIVPECVTGDKDAVDDDGNPVYQGIDQSKLVPLLTAALQEAIAKIETLEARLTAAGIE